MLLLSFFFFNDTATTEIYTLSLHDALPISSSLAEIFGARNYGTISGAVALGSNAARAVGPVGASLLLLGLGSYPAVFWALAASLVMAASAVALAGRTSRAEG